MSDEVEYMKISPSEMRQKRNKIYLLGDDKGCIMKRLENRDGITNRTYIDTSGTDVITFIRVRINDS